MDSDNDNANNALPSFTIEVDGKEVEMIHGDKPSIWIDGLREMGQSFFENVSEGDTDPPDTAVYAATITRNLVEELEDNQEVHLPPEYVKLRWTKDIQGINPGIHVMSEAEMREVEWPNNLDTLIDDTTGVVGMVEVIFAGLECARQGRQVYLQNVPNDENMSMVWFI
jgi:hypothetical protein